MWLFEAGGSKLGLDLIYLPPQTSAAQLRSSILPTGAFRSTLSSSSQSSSPQERSPEPIRIHRVLPTINSVTSPERSRQPFSSEIFSHRKKESTDSTNTLVARSDSIGSRRLATSPPATPEQKATALTRPPLITSPRARRALLSKQETLGLPVPSPIHRFVSSIAKPSLSNDTPSILQTYRPIIQERRAPFRPPRRIPNVRSILKYLTSSFRKSFWGRRSIGPSTL